MSENVMKSAWKTLLEILSKADAVINSIEMQLLWQGGGGEAALTLPFLAKCCAKQ